ncbi:MAG: MerR family transcriptional regulator [Planctomycetes bacterium]|nr:MerR family transcriptional regulator [Planctomycetota bacterium]
MTGPADDEYGIGAVARLTGLSDHTIRVWERRYQAVVAERTETGRRLYRTSDVEKLRLLKLMTDKGVAISQIAGDSIKALKERLASMQELAQRPDLSSLSVAVVGDFLPALVRDRDSRLGPLDVVIAETNLDRFEIDLQQIEADALVLELATITPEVLDRIQRLRELSRAKHCVVVYTFARSVDVEVLASRDVVLLRAPVRIDEVVTALVKLDLATPRRPAGDDAEDEHETDREWPTDGVIVPRRFDNEQLSRLARITSSIDCECPRHLAELVGQLAAFEIYSASCASRDEDDRALHRYLYRASAAARAGIEAALARVVEAEGIEV